ncbi:DMT family transporter [Pseudodonghicola flavimaris]|uniref:DMT family transporter n=1 Tax=Pseudodonghicola flavimaris TaxID=3050036 RepID=A0ABT7EWT9_9RHOB|nr:DMT family transporter [Pseudodonghicola flavimaris]MDK3016806.1 DMT family transporter [Pseudodonghicola flavimaris]
MTHGRREQVWLAIGLTLLSLVLFDLMGLVIKFLSPHYGAAELSAYRNLIGLAPSLIALWTSASWRRSDRRWIIRQWPLAGLRGVFVTFAQFLFYLSLAHLAFATASTITYSNALFMTAFAVPILGERVGLLRWSAVLLGFAGVVWIMKPGSDSFDMMAMAPIGSAMLYALAAVTARRIDPEVPSPLVNLYSSGTAMVGAIVLALCTGGFDGPHSLADLGWIVAMGSFGGTAVLCMVAAYRMAEQSTLAPFSYFGIPFALLFGWLIFDEAPFADLFPGALLIVAGGLMVIWRERRMRRRG